MKTDNDPHLSVRTSTYARRGGISGLFPLYALLALAFLAVATLRGPTIAITVPGSVSSRSVKS